MAFGRLSKVWESQSTNMVRHPTASPLFRLKGCLLVVTLAIDSGFIRIQFALHGKCNASLDKLEWLATTSGFTDCLSVAICQRGTMR